MTDAGIEEILPTGDAGAKQAAAKSAPVHIFPFHDE